MWSAVNASLRLTMKCWSFKNQAHCNFTGVGSVVPLARSLLVAKSYSGGNIFCRKSAVSDDLHLK